MTYQIIRPPKDLEDFVSHFWVAQYNSCEPTPFTYYSTANTTTEIAIAFKTAGNKHNQILFSSVQGHTSRAVQIATDSFVEIMGASIYSYAVPLFLNVSPTEIVDQFADLHTLLGAKACRIIEAIENAAFWQQRIQILASYLRSQLRKEMVDHQILINAIRHLRKNNGMVPISELAAACCLSKKTFERKFTAFSGFKPKQYARIVRFESAFWHCRNFKTLTEAAHAYGYYDQSHFIRDFKTFTGYSPHKFFSLVPY